MKRFSWLSFILGALLHLYGTSLLIDAGLREEYATRYGAPSQHALALKVWAWVWLPVPMLLKPLFEHHGPFWTNSARRTCSISSILFSHGLLWWGHSADFSIHAFLDGNAESPDKAMERTADRCPLHC
jgi:hypothetical protein